MNINFDRACAADSLKFLSTITGGVFAGGALYVNLVESPARLTHDPETAVAVWRSSFVRAKFYLGNLNTASSLCSIAAFWLSGDKFSTCLLAGGTVLSVMNTLLFILPVNGELMDPNKCAKMSDEVVVGKLKTWNKLHAIRSVIGFCSFGYLLWMLAKRK